jgi:hypothetical protein
MDSDESTNTAQQSTTKPREHHDEIHEQTRKERNNTQTGYTWQDGYYKIVHLTEAATRFFTPFATTTHVTGVTPRITVGGVYDNKRNSEYKSTRSNRDDERTRNMSKENEKVQEDEPHQNKSTTWETRGDTTTPLLTNRTTKDTTENLPRMVQLRGTTRPAIAQSLPINPNTFQVLGNQTEDRRKQNRKTQPREELQQHQYSQHKYAIEQREQNTQRKETAKQKEKDAKRSTQETKQSRQAAINKHNLQLVKWNPSDGIVQQAKDKLAEIHPTMFGALAVPNDTEDTKRQYQATIQQRIKLLLNLKSQLKRATTRKERIQVKKPMDQQEREEGDAEEERRESDIQVQVIAQNATMITKTNNEDSLHLLPTAGVKAPPDETPPRVPLSFKQNFNLQSKVLLYYGSWLRNYGKAKQQKILTTIGKRTHTNGEHYRADELKQSTDTSITSEGNLHYSTQRKHGGRQGLPNKSYTPENNTSTTTTKNGTHNDTTTCTRNENATKKNSNSKSGKIATNHVLKSTETGEYVDSTMNETLTQSPRHAIQRDTRFTTETYTGLQGHQDTNRQRQEYYH